MCDVREKNEQMHAHYRIVSLRQCVLFAASDT